MIKEASTIQAGVLWSNLDIFENSLRQYRMYLHSNGTSIPLRCDGHSNKKWLALVAIITVMSFVVVGTLAIVLYNIANIAPAYLYEP